MSERISDSVLEAWRVTDAGSAPVDALLAEGARLRRRRMIAKFAVPAVASLATVGMVVASAIGFEGGDGGFNQRLIDAGESSAAGQLVGMSGIAILVPNEWVTLQLPGCTTPDTGYVYFVSDTVMSCPYGDPGNENAEVVPSVGIGAVDQEMVFTDQHESDGLVIEQTDLTCSHEYCERTYAANGVAFKVRSPVDVEEQSVIDQIGSSVRTIPDSFVAVPHVVPGTTVEDGLAILATSGLDGKPSGDYTPHQSAVLSLDPAPGSVVDSGSSVNLEVSPD